MGFSWGVMARRRRLMPSREHLTRKVPSVHPTWPAISAALRPWRTSCGMRAIAAGVRMVGFAILLVRLNEQMPKRAVLLHGADNGVDVPQQLAVPSAHRDGVLFHLLILGNRWWEVCFAKISMIQRCAPVGAPRKFLNCG